MGGDSGPASNLGGTKPLGVKPQPRAKGTLVTESVGRFGGRRVVNGIARLQIATNTETLQQRDQLIHRLMT
jgi:hypothetical protein